MTYIYELHRVHIWAYMRVHIWNIWTKNAKTMNMVIIFILKYESNIETMQKSDSGSHWEVYKPWQIFCTHHWIFWKPKNWFLKSSQC